METIFAGYDGMVRTALDSNEAFAKFMSSLEVAPKEFVHLSPCLSQPTGSIFFTFNKVSVSLENAQVTAQCIVYCGIGEAPESTPGPGVVTQTKP